MSTLKVDMKKSGKGVLICLFLATTIFSCSSMRMRAHLYHGSYSRVYEDGCETITIINDSTFSYFSNFGMGFSRSFGRIEPMSEDAYLLLSENQTFGPDSIQKAGFLEIRDTLLVTGKRKLLFGGEKFILDSK